MSNVTKEDVQAVYDAKEAIESAIEQLNEAVRNSNERGRYESYIKGALEQACENFTGCGGYSLEELAQDMQVQQNENDMVQLAISLGQDDAMDDLDHLKDRLSYYTNEEWDEHPGDEEVQRQIDGLTTLINNFEE